MVVSLRGECEHGVTEAFCTCLKGGLMFWLSDDCFTAVNSLVHEETDLEGSFFSDMKLRSLLVQRLVSVGYMYCGLTYL